MKKPKQFRFYQIIKQFQIALIIIAIFLAHLVIPFKVSAATLTKTTILEIGGASNVNPMIVSDGQELAVDFKTVASGATTASINFNNFTGGSVNATQTISSTNCTNYFPNATLLPGGSLSASGSGTTISISNITALSATTEYCTILTSNTAVTNPGSGGVYSALVTVGADSQNAAFDVLASGANAYSVTGTVAPSFTMSLSGTTDNFASNLSSSSLSLSPGITATINTNAVSGWFLWAEDSNAGLHSTQQAHTIATVSTGSNHTMNGGTIGTEAYALGVTVDNTTNYAYGGGTTGGGLSTTIFEEIATNAAPASNVTTVLHELADISGTTQPATDYTDTITVIGAGSF
jgi:hypothetical protein